MTVKSILSFKGWINDRLKLTYEDSDLKTLETLAGRFHTDVENANEILTKGYYCIKTFITGSRKQNYFKLEVNAKYYGDKSKHEHKKNTHRQKIDI